MPQLFAEVAVNSTFPHRQTFSYAVPAGLDVQLGHAVYVPFGRLTLQGVVLAVSETPAFSEPEKIREIRSLVGARPLLDVDRVALAQWVAHHYIAPVFDAVSLLLPPGFERKPVTIVRPLVDADEVAGLDLPQRQAEALAVIAQRASISVDDLREAVSYAAVEPVVAQLERRELVAREYALQRPRIGPKTVEVASLAVPPPDAAARIDAAEPPKASRRANVLERLLERRRISDAEAQRLAGSRANLDRLIRAGDVRFEREGHEIELAIAPKEALDEIASMRRTKRATDALAAVARLEAGDQSLTEVRAAGIDTATMRWLADIGVAVLREEAVQRDPLDRMTVAPREPAHLLPAQQLAADAICASIDAAAATTFLLLGVTGSGMTEVYLHALDHCIAHG
jgi:primosomal protein N'